MFVLVITKAGRELSRSSVSGGLLLIGRSPVCDIVLRAAGIQSVHYLLEWIGEGDPKPGPGDWALFDLNQSARGMSEKQSLEAAGQGMILAKAPVKIGEFSFSWVEDRLVESVVEGGIIRSQIKDSANKIESVPLSAQAKKGVLEAIEVDVERESVTEILHLPVLKIKRPVRPLRFEVPLTIVTEFSPVPRPKITIPEGYQIQVLNRGVPVKSERELTVGPQDILQVNWKLKEYYFRLVPEVAIPPVPRSFMKDPIYRWFAFACLLFLLLIFISVNIDIVPEELPKEPPRVAKVEIQDFKEPPPPPPPELPKEEPKKPEPKPPPDPVVQKKPKDQIPQKTIVRDKTPAPRLLPTKRNDTEPERAGLNTKAPPANVNAMGVLGAINKTGKPNQVRADKVINEGIVSDNVAGENGNFTIQQPPMGVIGSRDKKGTTSLAQAGTTLRVGDKSSSGSLATIAGGKGVKGDTPDYDVVFKGDDTEGESVEGGLDRETVFRTIQAYRRELRACYEKALLTKPRLRGRMVFKWNISPQGASQAVRLERSEVGLPSFEGCTKQVIQDIKWPKALNGRPTIVRYPFEFQKKN